MCIIYLTLFFRNKYQSINTKNEYQNSLNFLFELFFADHMLKYMNEFDCKKGSGVKVPPKVIKLAKEEIIAPISNCINNFISSNVFLNEYIFKAPGVVPVLRK